MKPVALRRSTTNEETTARALVNAELPCSAGKCAGAHLGPSRSEDSLSTSATGVYDTLIFMVIEPIREEPY